MLNAVSKLFLIETPWQYISGSLALEWFEWSRASIRNKRHENSFSFETIRKQTVFDGFPIRWAAVDDSPPLIISLLSWL